MNHIIKNFTDLNAWKYAHKLALDVYSVTKKFPDHERFGLVSQMQRSSVSIVSNIAEGFGRNTAKDKRQFYTMSRGSLLELHSQILIARDLGYTNKEESDMLLQQLTTVSKLISGLTKSAKGNGID